MRLHRAFWGATHNLHPGSALDSPFGTVDSSPMGPTLLHRPRHRPMLYPLCPRAVLGLLIGAIASGCGGRVDVYPVWLEAPHDDAGAPAVDAKPYDVPPEDQAIPSDIPVSELKFEDVHLTTGNPRKINPNTIDGTEPDNVVRFYVDVLGAQPLALSFSWSVDQGEVVSDDGASIRFRSHEEGDPQVKLVVTNLDTGKTLTRTATLTVRKAFQTHPILRGDYVAWDRSQLGVEVVHLPTRTLVSREMGGLSSFDGKRVAGKASKTMDHKILLWDVVDQSSITITTPTMQAAWDHRFISLQGDRLYWANTDTTYEQLTLFTMNVNDQVEHQVYGPTLVLRATPVGQGLVIGLKSSDGYGYVNRLYDPNLDTTQPLTELDPYGLVMGWDDPWWVMQDTSGFTLLDHVTFQQLKVKSAFDSIVSVEVSKGFYGGHAREAFGNQGEIFLVEIGGSYDQRIKFPSNDFLDPSLDGSRIAWTWQGDIYLYEKD